jgi:hypothetical protein
MFRYTKRDMWGTKTRGHKEIAVGDWVRSHYCARWRGVVLELNPQGGMATVRQVLDRRGVPIRKPKTVQYHCNWFTVEPKPES